MNFEHSHFCLKENALVTCSDGECQLEFTIEKCHACLAEESADREIPGWAFEDDFQYRDDYKDSLTEEDVC